MPIYTRKIPKVLKTINPPKELIQTLYEEEVFDCIKKEIKSIKTITKEQQVIQRRRTRKENMRLERARLKDVLVEKYGEEVFKRFNSKNKRKAVRSELTEAEAHALKYWANQRKEKIKQANRRIARKKNKGTRNVYDTYINSKDWERRRNVYWQSHPKRCAVCDTANFIHLHHMDYGKLGNEPDNHLIALCSVHHADYHSQNGVQRHMIRKTNAYIKTKKEEIARSKAEKEAMGTL